MAVVVVVLKWGNERNVYEGGLIMSSLLGVALRKLLERKRCRKLTQLRGHVGRD